MNIKIPWQKKPYNLDNKLQKEDHTRTSVSNSEVFNSKWIFPLISLGLLVLLFSIRKIANLDTGFHLAAGRWILTNFSVPVKDIFTYTVSQNEYIDIMWLYQVLIYSIYSFFDYTGVTILNSLVIISVFYVLFKRMNLYGVPVFLSLILLAVTAVTIQFRFGYRPEMFSWLFMLYLLLILERYHYKGKAKLFLLPVIMLLWVNMHGLFILGLIIIGSYMISISVSKKSIDKKLFKWFLVSIAAIFINPYFIKGAMFPFYLFTRLQKENIFHQNITELRSPWEMTAVFGFEIYMYCAISVFSLVLVIITFRKRSLHQIMLLAAFFYISISSFRNVSIFIFYSVYIIAICMADILNYENVNRSVSKVSPYEKFLKIIFSVVLLLICVRIITGAYYLKYNSEIKFGTGIDETVRPEQTVDFINFNSINGRIINNLEIGGWLEWRTKLPVFIDGRLEVIKEEFYKEYLTSYSYNGLSNLTEKFDADLVINGISNYNWTIQMSRLKSTWRLIHWDQAGSVYSKRGFNDNIISNFNSPIESCGIDTNEFTNSLIDEIIESGHIENAADWLSGFYSKKIKPAEFMRMGNFAYNNFEYRTAVIFYLNYIKEIKGSMDEFNYTSVYRNLGSSYYLLNDFKRSLKCYEKYLLINSNEPIENRVIELKRKLGIN